ncbi:MAG: bifunctional UDP-N-acetylglucosamine diphosphorylase/glucosamine-1-phosphate N-acetyltransferase GlmU [Endomicrobiia bacterium]
MKKTKLGCVILAAGEGTRMKSEYPKVLFDICGKSMIDFVIDTAAKLNIEKIYVVLGYKGNLVKQHVLNSEFIDDKIKQKIIFVEQKKQLGSADALAKVKKVVDKNIKQLLVLSGDVPLVSVDTLKNLVDTHISSLVECSVLSVIMDNPSGYGRIIRDISKKFIDIVEETEADENQKSIKEVNSGIYIFKLPILWSKLAKVKPNNKKNEYFLTDVIRFLSLKQTVLCKNPYEVKGINTRKDLVEAEEIVRKQILEKLMLDGVTIRMPATVYVDFKSKIENDVEILPGSIILNSYISKGCVIGPYSVIINSFIKESTKIVYSHIIDSKIGQGCKIGPFSRLRPQTNIEDNVRIGNFVEIKNSMIKNNTKVNHLSYIGDTTLSENVNIGAGTITCNFDGVKKHKTFVGKNVFVGSNVNLIAPIEIGDNVVIAAGSTITRNVPSNTFVIARAQEIQKQNHRIVKKLSGGEK